MCNIFGNLTYGVILRNNPSEPCYVPIELAVHDQKICELCAIFVDRIKSKLNLKLVELS
jgi:hypothetical protein